ncbi:MAG: hypothetical protein ACOC4Y_01785 [bacterium]
MLKIKLTEQDVEVISTNDPYLKRTIEKTDELVLYNIFSELNQNELERRESYTKENNTIIAILNHERAVKTVNKVNKIVMDWGETEMEEIEDCKKVKDFIETKIEKENFENYYNCPECNYIGNGWGILFSGDELITVNPENKKILPCPKCGADVKFKPAEWAKHI